MKSAKIISFGLAPKDVKEKAPEASPVSSLGRLLFTSCVIRDSLFLSDAPLELASPFARAALTRLLATCPIGLQAISQ